MVNVTRTVDPNFRYLNTDDKLSLFIISEQWIIRRNISRALQAQAMAKESDRRRLLALQRIGSALQRIEDGDYGNCLSCGEPIMVSRLEVDPAALLCIDCASKAE